MDRLRIVDAFKRYGATLQNYMWAVSAIAPDGGVVISCWDSDIRTANKVMHYQDCLSSWSGKNPNGSRLLREHLEQAVRDVLPLHLVLAHPAEPNTGRIAEYFHVRTDVVGKVVTFDGDAFALEFSRRAAEE